MVFKRKQGGNSEVKWKSYDKSNVWYEVDAQEKHSRELMVMLGLKEIVRKNK